MIGQVVEIKHNGKIQQWAELLVTTSNHPRLERGGGGANDDQVTDVVKGVVDSF